MKLFGITIGKREVADKTPAQADKTIFENVRSELYYVKSFLEKQILLEKRVDTNAMFSLSNHAWKYNIPHIDNAIKYLNQLKSKSDIKLQKSIEKSDIIELLQEIKIMINKNIKKQEEDTIQMERESKEYSKAPSKQYRFLPRWDQILKTEPKYFEDLNTSFLLDKINELFFDKDNKLLKTENISR